MLRGVYTDWTAPFLHGFRNPHRLKNITRYDYLDAILVLSALMWKKHNGKAILYTDSTGYAYYEKRELLGVWDEVDTELLNSIDHDRFSPATYWAFGKLLSFKYEPRNSVQLDTDLIVWKDISGHLESAEMLGLHPEPLEDSDFAAYYVDNPIPQRSSYEFKEGWNLRASPINTAVLYIANQEFVDYWFSEIERYTALNGDIGLEKDRAMLFVDQQLLGICLDERKVKCQFLFDNVKQIGANDAVTHLWLYKRDLNSNRTLRRDFTSRIIRRIKIEFPEYLRPKWMKGYLNERL